MLTQLKLTCTPKLHDYLLYRFVSMIPSDWTFILFCMLSRMIGVGSAMFITALFSFLPKLYPSRISTTMVCSYHFLQILNHLTLCFVHAGIVWTGRWDWICRRTSCWWDLVSGWWILTTILLWLEHWFCSPWFPAFFFIRPSGIASIVCNGIWRALTLCFLQGVEFKLSFEVLCLILF